MSYMHFKNGVKKPRKRISTSRAAASRKSFRKEDDTRIIASSGNVFRDLGFSVKESANLLARADLMIEIDRMIKRRKLTQSSAAKLFGVTQPRISDLMCGKINVFSVDSLMEMLGRAGVKVEFRIKAA